MGLIRRAAPAPARPTGRFRVHRPHRAVTASAVSVGVQDRERAAGNQGATGHQQSKIARALSMYDREGACWYPAQFYSRSMERIRFFPAVLNDNGEPEESEDPALQQLFARIRDPGGTTIRSLAANYGRLRFLIGDGSLLASEDDDGNEQWEYLSPLELKRIANTNPQQYERDNGIEKLTLTEAGELENIGGDRVRVWRLWRRHPTKSGWSDAPVLAVLDLYETLISLTLATGAEALSRAAQRGLLFIPDELTMADDGSDDTDDDPEADPLLREFIEGLTNAIQNPGSVDAMSPFVMRGPGLLSADDGTGRAIPTAEALKWLALGPQDRYLEAEAADKIIARIELGLDMPTSALTATSKLNHWSGWLLDEQGFRQHVAPVVEEFCDDLASAYLRRAAIAEGIADADRVTVWYDPVDAVAHPDEVPVAKDAWENGVVSSDYYRDKIGAEDGDAPTEEDLAILFALKGRTPPGGAQDGETAPQDGGTGGDANEQPPANEPQNARDAATASAAGNGRASMILGAAEMQVRSARKTAGSRLRTRSKDCGECQDAIDGLAPDLVASTLGRARVREIINGHVAEASLVRGAGVMLASQIADWGVRGELAAELGAMVEAHALRTLYEPKAPPLPPGFVDAVDLALP